MIDESGGEGQDCGSFHNPALFARVIPCCERNSKLILFCRHLLYVLTSILLAEQLEGSQGIPACNTRPVLDQFVHIESQT